MIKVAIDVGGTFTDCLVLDDQDQLHQFKSPTTPGDPTLGLMNVLKKTALSFGMGFSEFLSNVGLLIAHGTTLSTNALLTGKIAKTGLIRSEERRVGKEC